jgi:hypothetical protein
MAMIMIGSARSGHCSLAWGAVFPVTSGKFPLSGHLLSLNIVRCAN